MSRNSSVDYKKLKEDFVSNLSGSSAAEINHVTAIAPVAIIVWSVLQARQSFFRVSPPPLALAVDFFLNVGAILLAITLYADKPLLLCALLLAPAVVVFALPPNLATGGRKKPRVPPPSAVGGGKAQGQAAAAEAEPAPARKRRNNQVAAGNGKATPPPPAGPVRADTIHQGGGRGHHGAGANALDVLSLKPFVTTYRGCMMVVTCLAILAVDFRLFPRRFAKVETWGTSLMDMGVGSFVWSAGLVAARPVLKERATMGNVAPPLWRRLVGSLRHSLPLIVLGFVRLASVKGVDYAEHVSEYGVHWNFFFTLGLLPPFVAAFQSLLKVVPSYAALAVLLSAGYELVLDTTPLKAWALTAPRTDLLSMNREGVCSFAGYLAIFLSGQDAGMFVLPRTLVAGGGPGRQRNNLLLTMAVWAGAWCALCAAATNLRPWGLGLTVSRRLANLPYVLWVAAFNSCQLLAFCVVDTVAFPAFYNAPDAKSEKEAYLLATSRVLRAFNRNGLALFLLANLLTGLINLTVPTLDASPALTMLILVAYAATLTAVGLLLDHLDISVKL